MLRRRQLSDLHHVLSPIGHVSKPVTLLAEKKKEHLVTGAR